MGIRALLATPLVRDGVAIGLIQLRRSEPRPFTDKQIALLKTFADQAVIAIENVRLFNELQTRNRDLTEALEQQTASERDPPGHQPGAQTDVQPVFEAIADSALRLIRRLGRTRVLRYEGGLLRLAVSARGPGREATRS